MKPIYTLFCLFLYVTTHFSTPVHAQYGRGPKRMAMGAKQFYDHRGGFKKNVVSIQALQLPVAARIGYERALGGSFSLGILASYQYLGKHAGSTKLEGMARLFLSHYAPAGFFLYASMGQAQFKNHELLYRMTDTEGGVKLEYDPSRKYTVSRNASFQTIIAGAGIGYQNLVGMSRRILVNFSLGYQYYKVPAEFDVPIVENQLIYGKLDPNNKITGATSPLQIRLGAGYVF